MLLAGTVRVAMGVYGFPRQNQLSRRQVKYGTEGRENKGCCLLGQLGLEEERTGLGQR